jgi:stage V sporulation protein B
MRLLAIGYSEIEATDLYGQLSGTAQTFINFPQVFSIAIAMSLVPTITESFTKGENKMLNMTANLGMRTALLIGLPSAIGLFVLAEPIIVLFYPALGSAKHASVGYLLAILAISVIFLTIVQSLTAILQAVEKQKIPVKNLAIGALVKVILTYILVGIKSLNVAGAAYSTIAAYFTAAVLNYLDLKKKTNIDIKLRNIVPRPLAASLIMGIIVFAVYFIFNPILGVKITALFSIALGIFVYVIALPLTKAITKKDLELLPKGDKIEKLLIRLRLMKEEM